MATITVRCPTCDCELELDAAHRGQEVECGSCHQVFVAEAGRPASGRKRDRDDRPRGKSRERDRDDDEDDRRPPPRRRSRRYEEEDDDYDDDYYERRRRREKAASGFGDTSLVLGILSVFVFWCPVIALPLTVVGVTLGALGLKSTRNGTAVAGLVLNILFLIVSLGCVLTWGGLPR